MKKPLVIVAGPTGAGKTGLAVELALAFNGEIVSADSMQIYRGMDIGTAKADSVEQCGVKHYMLDIVASDENYSTAEYQTAARECIQRIHEAGKLPILVGGTGLYINSVIFDMDFCNSGVKSELRERLNGKSDEELYAEITEIDPESAVKLTPKDRKRIVRALEIYYTTGVKKSESVNDGLFNETVYDCVALYTERPRTELYERINMRVDIMVEQGLVGEVRGLLDNGCPKESQSMQAIGYKEIIKHLDGEITLEEAVELIKINTRHYAKRQETWFKRYEIFNRIDMNNSPYEQSCNIIEARFGLKRRQE